MGERAFRYAERRYRGDRAAKVIDRGHRARGRSGGGGVVIFLLFALLAITTLALIGHFSMPRRERLPMWRWGFRDLFWNVAFGGRVLGEMSSQHAELLAVARQRF